MTGRAIDRQFRFVPDEETVQTIQYCLGLTLRDYSVQLHAFVWMSNHYHLVLTDVEGELPDFMRDLNSKISRALNAQRKIRGQNFARESYNLVVPADEDAILRHCVYTEANPCAADLVERATDWEGLSSAGMDYGEELTVHRPNFGLWSPIALEQDMDQTRARYRGSSDAPEKVTIRLVRPPCMQRASAKKVRKTIRAEVRSAEARASKDRQSENRRVLGMAKVKATYFKDSPEQAEAMFQSEPLVSGKDPEARQAIQHAYETFVHLYRQAWLAFKRNRDIVFPHGTWWMRKRLNANCAAAPP